MSQCCKSPKLGSHFPCLAPCPAQTPRPDVCNSQNVTGVGTAQGWLHSIQAGDEADAREL